MTLFVVTLAPIIGIKESPTPYCNLWGQCDDPPIPVMDR